MGSGKYKHRVRFERPVADDSLDGAGSGTWTAVKELWAEWQDVLPSRGESIADGITLSARPARVRIRYRTGLTSAMRICLLRFEAGEYVVDRTAQIISGPATLGNRDELEFMVEELSPAGNAA